MCNNMRAEIANKINEAIAEVEAKYGVFGTTDRLTGERIEYINALLDAISQGA